jgi:hypothetical protein
MTHEFTSAEEAIAGIFRKDVAVSISGYIPMNAEFLIEYLFSVGLSPQDQHRPSSGEALRTATSRTRSATISHIRKALRLTGT